MNDLLETNLLRLLSCTEDLVSSHDFNRSRYQDYSQTLDRYFHQLSSSEFKPDAETLRHYELRLKKLKSNYNTTALDTFCGRRLPNTSWMANKEKVDHYNLTEEVVAHTSSTNDKDAIDSNISTSNDYSSAELLDSVEIRTPVIDSRDLISEERRKINRELREQLLSDSKSFKSGSLGEKNATASAHLLRNEELHREKLASEMLGFVRDLKDQSNIMSQRLRSDCVTLDNSIEHANRNTNELKKIQNQLETELGSKCGCVVWILFIITIFLFFEMIFFMKLFRKRVFSHTHTTANDEL